MAIEFVCPACQGTLRVGDEAAGRVVRCGSCMTTLRVPEQAPAAPEPPPARTAAEPVAPPVRERGGSPGEFPDRPPARRTRRRRAAPPPRSGRGVLFWLLVVFGIGAFFVVLACGGLMLAFAPKWRTHHSDDGGFKVDLPADPVPNIDKQAKVRNQPNAHAEGTVLPLKLEQYVVFYWDFTPAERRGLSDDDILDEAMKGIRRDAPNLKEVQSRRVTVSGFDGREVEFEDRDGGRYYARLVVADTRLFIVAAGGPQAKKKTGDIARFLDSFAITDEKLLARAEDRRKVKELGEEGAKQARERSKRKPDADRPRPKDPPDEDDRDEEARARDRDDAREAGVLVGERLAGVLEAERKAAPARPRPADEP